MRKSIIFGRTTAFLLILFFTLSCTEKNEYLEPVPANSSFVANINIMDLAKNAGQADLLKNLQFTQMIEGLSEHSSKLIQEIIKNPQESGIDIRKDIVLFADIRANKAGLVASINDATKFGKLLETLSKDQLCSAVSKENEISIAQLGEQAICVYTDRKLLILPLSATTTSDPKTEAVSLLKQSKEKSILSNKEFDKYWSSRETIGSWMNLGNMPTEITDVYQLFFRNKVDLSKVYLTTNVSFEKGKVVISSEYYSNDKEVNNEMETYTRFIGSQQGRFLPYLPEKNSLVIGFNLDGKELSQTLDKDVFKNLDRNSGVNAELLLSSIKGDILLSLIQASSGMIPDLAIFISTTDDTILNTIVNTYGILGIKKIDQDRYKMSMGKNNIYLGKIKEGLFITTDENIYDHLDKGFDVSMKQSPYASSLQKNDIGLVLDVETMRSIAGSSYRSLPQATKTGLNLFSYFELQGKGQKAELNLYTKDPKTNSLNYLLSNIAEPIGK